MNDKDTITCNQCGNVIELSAAISQEIAQKERKRLDLKIKEMNASYEERLGNVQHDLKEKFAAEREQMAAAHRSAEAALKARLQQEIEKKILLEIADLKEQVTEKEKHIEKMAAEEIGLRKRQRELEEREKRAELEKTRMLDQVRDQTAREFDERFKAREMENHQKLESLNRQIEVLKRKAEQGSQQLQGEALEAEMEDILKKEFVFDAIEPVAKGVRGGDILQIVRTQSGKECGRILWETKRTKAWSDKWISKLKDDQRESRADLAVLVSETLPPGFHHFRKKKEVWITDIPSALSLALALRTVLIQVDRAYNVKEGKNEKMELVYDYVTGREFRHRVETIIEAFSAMKDELDAEKKAMTRIWAKREKQIERVIQNTLGFHGDLEGIAGNQLPKIETLELGWEAEGEGAEDEAANAELDF